MLKVEYEDLDSAISAVAHGQARAILYFRQNYSWSLIRRLSEGVITPDRYVNSSMVNLYIDNAGKYSRMYTFFRFVASEYINSLKITVQTFKNCLAYFTLIFNN